MKIIGPHRVTNASVESPLVDSLFADGRRPAVMFSDPPWGDGNVGYWATKAAKDTGKEVPRISYETLIGRVFELADYVYGYVFIETGPRWEADTIRRMAAAGLESVASARLKYRSGSKWMENVLIAGARPGLAPLHLAALDAVAGWSGAAVAKECVARTCAPGAIVFDPCCGMGYTAQAALDNGCEFRGNELNPVRLDKTIARLEGKKTKLPA